MSVGADTAAAPPFGGTCDRRFDAVRAAFVDNLARDDALGQAVCVSIDGRPVVDLWGGHADCARRRPWTRDTLVNAFSVSKGLTALCALMLVDRGELELDVPVHRYWPEFAAAGKNRCTVRHLLSHQAGLPAIGPALPAAALYDWDRLCAALAAQAPWWQPGAGHGYHVNTFGILVGELVRRVSGHGLGGFLRKEITGPLGADFHIGLPTADDGRAAEFLWPEEMGDVGASPDAADAIRRMQHHAYFNPPGFSGHGTVNTRAWRAAELPSANGCGTARGIARVYAALAAGGRCGDTRLLDRTLLDEATGEHVHGPDIMLGGHRTRFGLGFQLPQPARPFAPTGGGFGHFGAGGSVGFCDPAAGVAFGFVTNRMGPRWQSPHARRLIDALYDAL